MPKTTNLNTHVPCPSGASCLPHVPAWTQHRTCCAPVADAAFAIPALGSPLRPRQAAPVQLPAHRHLVPQGRGPPVQVVAVLQQKGHTTHHNTSQLIKYDTAVQSQQRTSSLRTQQDSTMAAISFASLMRPAASGNASAYTQVHTHNHIQSHKITMKQSQRQHKQTRYKAHVPAHSWTIFRRGTSGQMYRTVRYACATTAPPPQYISILV